MSAEDTKLMMGGDFVPPADEPLEMPRKHHLQYLTSYRAMDHITPKDVPNLQMMLWQGEEVLVSSLPEKHPAREFVARRYPMVMLDELQALLDKHPRQVVVMVPVLYCKDEEGFDLREVELEGRGNHHDAEDFCKGPPVIAVVPQLAVLNRSRAFRFGESPARAILYGKPARSRLEKELVVTSLEKQHEAEALAAWDTLFRHYSLNEELWRLSEVMKLLPFTLEEHPKMKEYEKLLEEQIGHLKNGGEADWYADGSPTAGIDSDYLKLASQDFGTPLRLKWMMAQAKERGFKSVAEFGSIEGVSLFYYVQLCPEVEWVGFEASEKAITRGYALADEAGLKNFHLVSMRALHEHAGKFDAVALFEVLEHNTPESGVKVLRQAESLVKPGGWVYITTPCGNWSLFDEHTQDIHLRKDHINAFTVKRMKRFLTDHASGDLRTLQVERIENPNSHEHNAWVFAMYQRT